MERNLHFESLLDLQEILEKRQHHTAEAILSLDAEISALEVYNSVSGGKGLIQLGLDHMVLVLRKRKLRIGINQEEDEEALAKIKSAIARV